MQELKLIASDNTELFVHSWCVNEPKAVILLAHGMAEHSMRYAEFAEFLNANGIDFYCHDQRGHGKSANGSLGHLRKGLDWKLMMDDLFTIRKKLIHTDCPVILMGHSMGSFLVRCAVQIQPNLFDGLIISGTGDSQGLIGKAGAMLTKVLC
ncbi:MAG: alpha/beta hydrolase, partial [Peptococcaceae bacterium]|nr:alpha/beta hydrolase [Peptococcaceae bacterium]